MPSRDRNAPQSTEPRRIAELQIADNKRRERAKQTLQPTTMLSGGRQKASLVAGWSWNVTTGEVAWSRNHFLILGLDPAVTKPSLGVLMDRIHRADRPLVRQVIEEATAGKQEYRYECRIVLADRSIRYIESTGYPLTNSSGALRYVGLIRDITALKRADRPVRAPDSKGMRDIQSTAAGELAATIAHDINQPLAAIVNDGNACLHWLARTPADLQEASASVRSIIAEAKRASRLIRQVRSFVEKAIN